MLDGKRGRRSRRRRLASGVVTYICLPGSSPRSPLDPIGLSAVYSLGAVTRYNCRSTPLEDDLAASRCMDLWHSTIGMQRLRLCTERAQHSIFGYARMQRSGSSRNIFSPQWNGDYPAYCVFSINCLALIDFQL